AERRHVRRAPRLECGIVLDELVGAVDPARPQSVVMELVEQVEFLLAQRPEGKVYAGYWEFPGGKVEADETPDAALVRELEEELGIAVDPAALAPLSFAALPGEPVVLLLYTCRKWAGTPVCLDGEAIGWFTLEEIAALPMPPLDVPLARALYNVTEIAK
ncbi:MAG: hypothetical protein RL702_2826, partial [Pseudomonadota bacterium]